MRKLMIYETTSGITEKEVELWKDGKSFSCKNLNSVIIMNLTDRDLKGIETRFIVDPGAGISAEEIDKLIDTKDEKIAIKVTSLTSIRDYKC